ncbi:MAG: ABC transporter substrate-binding protein [Campylobacterales bacterium]|nr:ABC transporter substrate-binding protein [Campylobacterales bacterium]
MKLKLAIEWFLNPDHLPFIVGIQESIFENYGLELEIIEPDAHYDGLEELRKGNIHFATNEPLHLIEQFDEKFLSLGSFFETKGGVLLKKEAYDKIKTGQNIVITTPVSNPVTDSIGFEIIRRYFRKDGINVTQNQIKFQPNGFEHIKYMKEGADGGWLYFYNFEGIEAQHEGMEVLYLDAEHAGFANFSALDLFTNKTFYETHTKVCRDFNDALKKSIAWIGEHPKKSLKHYYTYSGQERSALMDDIIIATLECFNENYTSSSLKALPILEFFKEIGITSLDEKRFKTAFLH